MSRYAVSKLRSVGSRCFKANEKILHRWPALSFQRNFSVDTLATIVLPPAVFGGLLVSLWTYKCVMMVLFQNKIIYMPSVPPFCRAEKVADYASHCRPIQWTEHAIKSNDGTIVKLLEGEIAKADLVKVSHHIVVLYFQGNASSLPPRLPSLSRILQAAQTLGGESDKFTLIALSYRGFWTSSGKPSQSGIEQDADAALQWIFDRFPVNNSSIVLWGQSIGAGAAAVSLANLLKSKKGATKLQRIRGLLLETPFTDLRAMLIALYPQKFLPYRYLGPFLMSTWDSKMALATVLDSKPKLNVLVLQAGADELVPNDHALLLQEICTSRNARVERVVIPNALHTEITAKPKGRQTISRFIASFGSKI